MPVIFSQQLISDAESGASLPLTHSRIMYNNVVRGAAASADTETAGFEVDAVQSYDTYDRWLPQSVPATATFVLAETAAIDYVLIASHNLGSTGSAFVVEHSLDGTVWTEFVPERIPSGNGPIAILTDEIQAAHIRIRITSSLELPRIGVIMAGKALAMLRPIYQGHEPVTLSRSTDMKPVRSEGGRWLGRSKVRKGFSTSYNWSNLTASWYRANFDPFVQAARTQPFGIAWRPETFPNEVAYAWTNDDIQPTNSGPRDLMSVGFSVVAHDSGDI